MSSTVESPAPGAAFDRHKETTGSGVSDDEVAALAKALAHPARVQIVRLLLEKQSCIGCDIVDEVRLAQSTVSEHLRILKAAGVIAGEVEHPRVCYSLNPDRLMPLASLLNTVFEKDCRGELKGSICCQPEADHSVDI
ncbi:MAG: metalloregulator ArsR/SmtB family transcription factor [Gammaproteobacteria bacterium]|nr:metalloregulator ArsR/SmtB family transcription factor [Gammaproteobacteria bacterium]